MTTLEDELRMTFHRQAEAVEAPEGLDLAVRRRNRGSRATQGVVAAVVVAVLGLGATVLAPFQNAPPPLAGGAPEVFTGPPRGSLATDQAFLDGVLDLEWTDPDITTRTTSHRVLFAGDVPGGRWALVSGMANDQQYYAWFAGPPSADGSELILLSNPRRLTQDTVSLYSFRAGQGVLVVVGKEGDALSISRAAVVTSDAELARQYEMLATGDGVTVVDLGSSWLPGLDVRIDRDGSDENPRLYGQATPDDSIWTDAEIVAASTGTNIDEAPNPQLARDLLDPLIHMGYKVGDLQPTVLHATPVITGAGQAIVLAVRVPSGALAIIGGHGRYDAQGNLTSGGPDVLALYPATTDVNDVLVVMRNRDPEPGLDDLVAYGPVGTEQFRVFGQPAGTFTGQGQSGRTLHGTPAEGITLVQALDVDGNVLAEGPIGEIADLSSSD